MSAICRLADCDTPYTHDKGLINCAALCGSKTVRVCELPIPDRARQTKLALEEHEQLPERDDDEIENGGGSNGKWSPSV